jgi:hypothetical protein
MKVFIVLFFCVTSSFAQDIYTENSFERNYFTQFYLGLPVRSSLLIGKELSEDIALSINANIVNPGYIGTDTRSDIGIGVKVSKMFSKALLGESIFSMDVINLELSSGLMRNYQPYSLDLDINIGSEKLHEQGICFVWNLGLNVLRPWDHKTILSASIKVGITYNY